MEEKKKNSAIITVFGLAVLMVALVGATFAYFRAQQGGTSTQDVSVTSNTTDNLSFTIGNDITFTASEANFYQGGTNISGNATASAILTPNNKTNQATMNYYMYLNLTSNPTVYSSGNTNHDAELVLQVFDGSNQLVTLSGLGNQVSLGNGYGYDITGKTGLITLLDNHAITANGSTTTENWSVVITLVNLNLDQYDNTNKLITGEVILRKDEVEQSFCEMHPEDLMCYVIDNYNASTMATGTTNLLYYHDENLEDGAEDGSYRYAGSNPNNYVCFGSDASNCPTSNLYRIIGFIPVDVVTDSTTNPETTERQVLYKLIKNDYATSSELGMTSAGNADLCYGYGSCTYGGVTENEIISNTDAFYWSGSDNNQSNTWSDSTLNTEALNATFLNNFSNICQNKIANVMWKVGGALTDDIYFGYAMNTLYNNEITNSGVNAEEPTSDGKTEISNKIGLMYISDYGYSSLQESWDSYISNFWENASILSHVWLYRGVSELTITRTSDATSNTIIIFHGQTDFNHVGGVRPTFYLNSNVIIDRTLHAGTLADPYRIS